MISIPESAAPPGASDRNATPLNRAPVAPIVLSSQDDVRTVVRVRYLSKALATVRFFPGTGGTLFRGICNLFGPLAARRLFRSTRHLCQEPRRVFSVLCRPRFSVGSLFHEANISQTEFQNHGQVLHEYGKAHV